MNNNRKSRELADEQATQRRYAKHLEEKARKPVGYAGPRNNLWTRTSVPEAQPAPGGELIGRVALVKPHEWLDGAADFYIGERYAELGDTTVYGWAAPIARTYFRGTGHYELCSDVAATRSLTYRGSQIVDFVDDFFREDAPTEPFRKRTLSVPKAPSRPGGRPLTRPVGASPTTPTAAAHPETAPPSNSNGLAPVRAEALLRAQLQAPRTDRLAPILATLQPDQYELVTVSAQQSTIIEGKPGTGKTIIAAHRAAYLVNEETPVENATGGKVLLIGPTKEYSHHVRQVVNRLTGDGARVMVLSLPELWERILRPTSELRGASSMSWQDVDWKLGRLAWIATTLTRKEIGPLATLEAIYEHLRGNGSPRQPLTTDQEWSGYLRRLPPYQKAASLKTHAPLLAAIKWAVAKPRDLTLIGHIIVDEAQDVTPLEWFLLGAINEAHAWTIIGDLNQRRSDHTFASWTHIREVLNLSDEETAVSQLKRGYRSTKPLLEFANKLLPREERTHLAFQEEGPTPTIKKVPAKEVRREIVSQVDRLLTTYPNGTVAVIAVAPDEAVAGLRAARWAAVQGATHKWVKDGREVLVAHPDRARGLEFDAVVVVEPGEFPQNYGRQGPLYTALTRANRELAVVHSKPLPDSLRR